jgi:ribonucleoside-diphosphate reductase alpha chain
MYYLRTQAATQAVQFTVEKNVAKQEADGEVCSMQDGCVSCGS